MATARRGRPNKPATPGRRSALGLRVTAQIKELLDSRARQSGRTQSQEAELLIELSSRAEQRLDQALELVYGQQLAGLLTLLGHAMREVGRVAGFMSTQTLEGAENWISDSYAFDQAVQAAEVILKATRPEGDRDPPPYLPKGRPFGPGGADLDEVNRNFGIGIAGPYLVAVADPELALHAELKRIGTEVREKLGPDVAERIRQNIGAPARRSVRKPR